MACGDKQFHNNNTCINLINSVIHDDILQRQAPHINKYIINLTKDHNYSGSA